MSMIPAEATTVLGQLVQALQSPDNSVRSQAEEQLNKEWVAQRPDMLLMGLVEQLRNSQDQAVRTRDRLHDFMNADSSI